MKKKRINPFYVVLVVTGVLFCVTACAYGVMTLRELKLSMHRPFGEDVAHPFMYLLDRYGFQILLAEIAVLALAAVAAIGTDEFWDRRSTSPNVADSTKELGHESEPL